MTDVLHETFTVTRELEAPPARVFAAFADEAVRRRWFRLPGRSPEYRHSFAVGGGEEAHSTFTHPDGTAERLEYRSRYLDIVPERRIVFGYDSLVDDVVRWTSLVTVLIEPDGAGSRLDWIEQVAFLVRTGDGSADLPHLRGGTILRLNGLPGALADAA
jgi:uncharacterized protein YndB with AHSA1/START domain